MTSPQPKPAYTWDYWGDCDPAHSAYGRRATTFSVGVFQWLPKANGKGVKKGKVVKRFTGYTGNPEQVYKMAHQGHFCASYESTMICGHSALDWLDGAVRRAIVQQGVDWRQGKRPDNQCYAGVADLLSFADDPTEALLEVFVEWMEGQG